MEGWLRIPRRTGGGIHPVKIQFNFTNMLNPTQWLRASHLTQISSLNIVKLPAPRNGGLITSLQHSTGLADDCNNLHVAWHLHVLEPPLFHSQTAWPISLSEPCDWALPIGQEVCQIPLGQGFAKVLLCWSAKWYLIETSMYYEHMSDGYHLFSLMSQLTNK